MRFYLTFIGIFIFNITFAQTTFQMALGGSQEEFGYSIQKTRNNGFICAGRTFSFGTGGWECYLVRLNSQGDTIWTKTYGNVLYDEFQDVDTTSDGGFIAVGHTTTTDFAANVYLIKTDSNGVHQWSKEYGGANGLSDKGYSVSQTSDGGYIISGTTASFGSGGDDMYVIKTTSTGNISWTSVIGTAGVNEAGREVQQTNDGGYIVAGYTDGIGQSFYDVLLVKLNSTGVVQWKKTYGGSSYDFAYTVQQTSDNGFIIGATTNSFGAGNWDAYLIKTDVNGNLTWSKTYGMSGEDRAQSARQTADGGYILCGRSSSFGFGSFDAILYKTDANGILSWTKAYGGTGDDQAFYAREISANNYVLCGYTVSAGAGIKDMYIIKTGLNGASGCNETSGSNFSTTTPNTITGTGATTTTGGTVINPTTAVRNTLTNKALICIFGGCSVNATFTASSTTICQNSTVQFTNNSTGSTGQSWYLNGTLVSSSLNFIQTFNTAGVFNISLVSSNGASCSDTFSTQIRVNPITSSNVTASSCQQYTWPVNNQTYLQSGTYSHTVTNSNGCDSIISLNLTIIQPSSNTTTVTACNSYTWSVSNQTYTQSGNYSFVNGCNTQLLNLTIAQNPIVTATNDTIVCRGNTITLFANGGNNYVWSPTTGLSNANISNPILTAANTITYNVTVTNQNGCSATESVLITVPLGISATPVSDTICQGQSTVLSASGAQNYSWSPNFMLNTATGSVVTANPIKTKIYTVTGTDIYGCTSTATSTVFVVPKPRVYLGPDIRVCYRTPVQLDAGQNTVSYLWNTGETTRIIIPINSGLYSVTITNVFGCTASDTVLVNFKKCYNIIAIPLRENSQGHKNEISQSENHENNLGIINSNDVFNIYPNPSSGIVNIDFTNANETYSLIIRNTLGQIIFEQKNLQEKSIISLEDYENGAYIFEIISKDINSSFIVIKK
jgi:hypothetical protein